MNESIPIPRRLVSRLLAAALELDVEENGFTSDGIPTQGMHIDSHWGGARRQFTTYVAATADRKAA